MSSSINSSTDKCTKPSCKNIVPDNDRNFRGEKFKKCKPCRDRDKSHTAACRKRKRNENTEPIPQKAPSIRQHGHLGGSRPEGSGNGPSTRMRDVSESDSSEEEGSENVSNKTYFKNRRLKKNSHRCQ
jgi:hypothetical protein